MRKTTELVIGDHTLIVKQWGAWDNATAALLVGKLLGASLAPIIQAVIKGYAAGGEAGAKAALVSGVDMSRIAAGLEAARVPDLLALAGLLEKATQIKFTSTIGSIALAPLNADEHFAGDLAGMLEWLAAGVVFNLAGFTPSGPNAPTSPKQADAPGP